MDWREVPVERSHGFRPPHCPWRDCPRHLPGSTVYRFQRHGSYTTQRGSTVPRFRCLTCRRTFSRQTFSVTYYLKKPQLLIPVGQGLVAGSANRQTARTLRCAPSTVAGLQARLGRHAMLFQARCQRELRGRLTEPVVFDHFISFEFTQDYPIGVATSVATPSWFTLSADLALYRRAGRISQYQRRRLEGRPPRRPHQGFARSTHRTFSTLLPLVPPGRPLVVRADGHKSYEQARRRHPQAARIRLESYPNPARGPKGSPRSPEARLRDERLFAVDLHHKIMRHSLSHHRRETIAITRRSNAAMERVAVFSLWRNFIKSRSERRPHAGTPAMALGLTSRPWGWERALSQRLFFDHEPLPEPWGELYRREWDTPLLSSNTRHTLTRAF